MSVHLAECFRSNKTHRLRQNLPKVPCVSNSPSAAVHYRLCVSFWRVELSSCWACVLSWRDSRSWFIMMGAKATSTTLPLGWRCPFWVRKVWSSLQLMNYYSAQLTWCQNWIYKPSTMRYQVISKKTVRKNMLISRGATIHYALLQRSGETLGWGSYWWKSHYGNTHKHLMNISG